MPRWSKEKRDTFARRCFELMIRGLSNYQIADALEINFKTVADLISEEGARRRIDYAAEIERSIHVYRAVQTTAWDRLRNIPAEDMSLIDPATGERVTISAYRPDATGYLNTIGNQQREIDKITGAARTRVEVGGRDGGPIQHEVDGQITYSIDWDDVPRTTVDQVLGGVAGDDAEPHLNGHSGSD